MLRQRWWSFFPFASNCFSWYCSGTRLSFHLHKYIHIATTDPQTCTYVFHSILFLYSSLYTPEIFKKQVFLKGVLSPRQQQCAGKQPFKKEHLILLLLQARPLLPSYHHICLLLLVFCWTIQIDFQRQGRKAAATFKYKSQCSITNSSS